MSYKLDIFDLLGKINSPRSGDIYKTLTEDEKKGFSPLITLRWMSGTSDERQILLLNEFVNPYVFSLGKHPHLLMHLLQVASSKTSKRYYWLSVKSKKRKLLAHKVITEYYDLSDREVNTIDPFPPNEEIIRLAEELGWDKDLLSQLRKEFKNGKGKES